MATVRLRIGGVPEHFNFPWRLAHKVLGYTPNGVDFSWQDYDGGTGFLREDLHAGKLDLAIMLTEGAVADINQGPGLKIIGQYVSTPLHWGVHVHHSHSHLSPHHLAPLPFAISRRGSGSHLMAYVYARQMGWDTEQLQFVEVNNLEGARQALAEGRATTFLWEKFTTKPLVDAGEWARLDSCPTPWPSFVLVGREDQIAQHPKAILRVLHQMKGYLQNTPSDHVINLIHQDLGLPKEDIARWLDQTEWECAPQVAKATLTTTQATLAQLGLVQRTLAPEDYVASFTELG